MFDEQFRLAGLTSDDPSDLELFQECIRGLLPSDQQQALRIVRFPSGRPNTAVAYLKDLQPPVSVHKSDCGSVLILDGEINCTDIRQSCSTGRFSVTSLAEHLARDPLRALNDLDANALIAFLDARDGCTYIARDAIGNVPVYTKRSGNRLAWSVDLPTLIRMSPDWRLNTTGVNFFIGAGYVPAPMTYVQGIEKLAPGHAALKRPNASPEHTCYIRYDDISEDEQPNTGIVEGIRTFFPEAVERRIRRPDQTGILLSGGVDSKTILAVANQLGYSPDCFTFRYLNYDGLLNETTRARQCAAHFGSNHYEIEVDPLKIPDRLPRLLAGFGEPFSYGLHTVMMGDVKKYGITDLLTGTGADGAWFSGSQQLGAIKLLSMPSLIRLMTSTAVSYTQQLLNLLHHAGLFADTPFVKTFPSVWSARMKLPGVMMDAVTPHFVRHSIFEDKAIVRKGRKELLGLFKQAAAELPEMRLDQQFRITQTRFYGAEMMQHWNHGSSRMHGLSIRTPYYDRKILNFMLGKNPRRPDKADLRQYAAELMPEEMARSPKLAQSVPLRNWLLGPLKEWVLDSLTAERLARTEFFDAEAVLSLLSNFYNYRLQAGTAGGAWTIWNILVLTTWLELIEEQLKFDKCSKLAD